MRDDGLVWYENNRQDVRLKNKVLEKFLNYECYIYCDNLEEKKTFMRLLEARKKGINWGHKNGGKPTQYNNMRILSNRNYFNMYMGFLHYSEDRDNRIIYFKDIIKKPKKQIKPEFFTDKIAANCKTEKEAGKFLKKLHKLGYTWSSGANISNTNWEHNKENTCYCFNFRGTERVGHSNKRNYQADEFKIVDYSDIIK